MKKEDVLKKLESDNGSEYFLRSDVEEKSFLDNYTQKILDEKVPPEIKKKLDEYDNLISDTIGKKKTGQKTTDFIREQFTELKTSAGRVSELETEIADLKKGKPDDAKLQEIKDLQKEIKRIKLQHEEELTTFAKQSQHSLIKADIERGLMDLKIKKDIPESVRQVYVNQIIDDLAKSAEMRDNQIVFLDGEKKALRNPATMAPYTAKELLAEKMKDLIDTGHQQQGIKLPKDMPIVSKDKDGKTVLNVTMPDNIRSKDEWGEYLVKELGLKRNTKDYFEAFKLCADLPLMNPK